MPSIFDGFLTQVLKGDNIKDYKHANRLFVDNNYELSPKYSWLFHVFFDLNPELTTIDQRQQIEAGMLVKAVDLPRFRIDTKTYNNYNRPHIAQTKVRYEDVNVTFHDDSANLIRKLWFDYYNYYYRDMDNNYGDATGALNDVYKKSNKQILGQRNLYNKFGYSPRKDSNISTQYIQAIRIYSLHQKRFSEYTLLNPTISSFKHGSHQNGQEGTLENVMTITYETVLYASGSARVARGFADLHYDKSPSPLTVAGGGTNSILGPGGIVNALDEVISDGSERKWGSAGFKALRAFDKNKNVDFRNLAKGELIQSFTNVLRGSQSGSGLNASLNSTYIPYRGVNASSGAPFQSALATQTVAAPGSVGSNGFNIAATAGVITGGVQTALSGTPTASLESSISGLTRNASGVITGADPNKIISLNPANNLTASSSATIPTNSFTAAIQSANERLRSLSNLDTTRSLQPQAGELSTALNNTPFRNFQIPASTQVAADTASNNLSSNYFGLQTSTEGKTSTNAAGSGFVNGGFGSVGPGGSTA